MPTTAITEAVTADLVTEITPAPPVPATLHGLWFAGSNYVNRTMSGTANGFFGVCTIKTRFWYPSTPASLQMVHSYGAIGYRAFINTTNGLQLNATGGVKATLVPGTYYAMEIDYDATGAAIALRLNGANQGIATVPAGSASSALLEVGARSGTLNWVGVIRDFEITGANGFNWIGDGNTLADWADVSGAGRDADLIGGTPSAAISTDAGNNWSEVT